MWSLEVDSNVICFLINAKNEIEKGIAFISQKRRLLGFENDGFIEFFFSPSPE